MITIIPAAGKSQRFKNAGYNEPKQLLPMPRLGDRMIWHVIKDIPKDRIHIIINKEDESEWFKFSAHPTISIKETGGPLDTTIQGLSRFLDVYPDQELLIVYSDVIFGNYDRFLHDVRDSGCVEAAVVFRSDDLRFGYARNGLAYAGIFYFRSFHDFLNRAVEVNEPEVGIPSVLQHNSLTNLHLIYDYQRIDLGTPEDYEFYLAVCREVE